MKRPEAADADVRVQNPQRNTTPQTWMQDFREGLSGVKWEWTAAGCVDVGRRESWFLAQGGGAGLAGFFIEGAQDG